MGDSKQRRNIQPRVLRWLPRYRRPNDHPIGRLLARVPDSSIGKCGELHFRADLEPFTRQNNGEHETLSEADLTPSISANFLFEKAVHRPFHMLTKILRQEQPHFKGIRKRFVFIEKCLRFTFLQWCRRTFVMQNMANAEFVLDEDRRVERNLVPIGQRRSGPSG